jgi:DNA-binding FadR family transcriptional regulator
LPAERDLADRFVVSRTTLREAIRELQFGGYVESRRGRTGGTFVTWNPPLIPSRLASSGPSRSTASISDTALLRDALEVGAAAAAASQPVGATQRRHLLACLAKVVVADLSSFQRADSRLHLAIAEATGSSSLVAAIADVRMRVNELLDKIPLLQRSVHQSNAQHRAIVAAIVARDPDAARVEMSEHLAGTEALLRAFLD